ncbi:MAG TPA: hypothetical protein PLW19_04230 [Anaerolineaceae bacterium]|nr:hypothetical protein [Anaerolineaceae bacterium]
MKKFEHKTYGKIEVSDITTKQYEDYGEMMGGTPRGYTKFRVDTLKAFLTLGLAKCEPELKPEDVDDLKPAKTLWLSNCISEVIAEAITIDPLA